MYKISQKNFLGNITIEVRPRLRSCIVFIYIGDKDPSLIDVKLSETNITITCEKLSKSLILPSVKLLPTSLSSLRISSKWISFRVQTNPDTIFGTFKTEIMNDIAKTIVVDNSKKYNLPAIGSKCCLRCKCCENIITIVINCKRVLPLPDRDCDPGEWFCCKHSTKVDFAKLLKPQETDYFYGSAFSVINSRNFRNLTEKYNTILCKKCLTILGMKEDNESIRIWNFCVERQINDEEFKVICHSALDEFIATIKDCSEIMGEEILLESLEGNTTHYILMKPMEWQLELLTEANTKWEGESIRLQKTRVIKVFYKYGESGKSVRNEFVHSKYYLIALPLLMAGIEHLISSTKRFPPSYRTVAQYYVGFINLKNSFLSGI
ncbi:uncharacterized protein LOC122511699 [Leptopilina heterotoma]|uniref:uncharacterized protein LOC122511699 n=1 Tax=Leptopilina heterotoma TaxID=63436 RepID=UPI001CA7E419|nr:uncharacterized protein LOC122511699 [Leptopilina heterotoma]